jgi:hypothetical protein
MLRFISTQTTDIEDKLVTEQLSFSTADIEQQIFYRDLSEPRYLRIEIPQSQMPGGRYVIVAGEPRLIIKEVRASLHLHEEE